MYKSYAGIGARKAPPEARNMMFKIGRILARKGYTLRSGAAKGADKSFEDGCDKHHTPSKEIYLPWDGFNGRHDSEERVINSAALPKDIVTKAGEYSEMYHPLNFDIHMPQYATTLAYMNRNANQVLGINIDDPVDFVVCYAWGSEVDNQKVIKNVGGGTGQAVRIAYAEGIRVYNLAVDWSREDLRKLISNLGG